METIYPDSFDHVGGAQMIHVKMVDADAILPFPRRIC